LIHRALVQHYKNEQGQVTPETFSSMPALFQTLDANQDGILSEVEALKLKDLPPHLELDFDLGPKGKGVKLLKASEEFQNRKDSDALVSVELPRMKLNATWNRGSAEYVYNDLQGESYVSRFDTDKNGYLESKELAGNYARIMEMWDLNEDGKVFAKEIVESYRLQRAPQATQVRATVTYDGNSVFQALDQSGDLRLSLREMRTAHEQLKPFDKNQDGRITPEEVPVTLGLTFVVGYGYLPTGQPANRAPAEAAKNSGPLEWFTRMDRNGDGDLTLKEFLGDKEQFQSLDSNQDGFIEPKEAQAAAE
jgi:Ca2+-binding EF-hand superfamily protein